MAVKFSQFNVGATVSDIDYIVGYKSTDNVQIPIGLVTANTTYGVATAQSGLNETLTLTGSDASTDVITFTAGADISLTDNGAGNGFTISGTGPQGTVTSVDYTSDITALTAAGGPITTSGTLTLNKNGGVAGQYIDGASGAWVTLPAGTDTTYDLTTTTDGSNVDVNLVPSTGSTDIIKLTPAGGITITQSGGVITLDTSASGSGTVTSVGLTMPSAFAVGGTPVTNSGTLSVTTTGGSAGQFLDYTGAWATPASGAPTKTVDQVTIANATTGTVTLSVSPTSEAYTDMYVSGVYQNKSIYSLSGSTITLDSSAYFPNGAVVEVVSTT